jgi:hypothetical protein
MLPVFLVFACVFASGFALRIIDPLIIPIAHHFGPLSAAALLRPFTLPYAIARVPGRSATAGKTRCIQVCIAAFRRGVARHHRTDLQLLMATRIGAGVSPAA